MSRIFEFSQFVNEGIEPRTQQCDIYMAIDGKWYLELSDINSKSDVFTYGPFNSQNNAETYLHNFIIVLYTDDSGNRAVPKIDKIIRGTGASNGGSSGGGYFSRGGHVDILTGKYERF